MARPVAKAVTYPDDKAFDMTLPAAPPQSALLLAHHATISIRTATILAARRPVDALAGSRLIGRNKNDAFQRDGPPSGFGWAGRHPGRTGPGPGPGHLSQPAGALHQPLPGGRADRHPVAPVLRPDERAHRPAMDRRESRRRRRQCRHGRT